MFNHLTWIHYTTGTGIIGFITAALVSKIAPGFLDATGEKIFSGAWGWVKQFFFVPLFGKKHTKKHFSGYQIGGLMKTVQYLKKQAKENTKTIKEMKKEIRDCTEERSRCSVALTEARTQIMDINIWRERFEKNFEKKMKQRTAQRAS